jgi:hypothetical protein
MMSEELNTEISLVQWLRRIQTSWELDLQKMSMICHVPAETLDRYFKMSASEVAELPSIPTGLDSAMPLVSVFKSISTRLPDADAQNEWLTTENETYEKNKPIEVMAMSPAHLAWVSYTLASPIE